MTVTWQLTCHGPVLPQVFMTTTVLYNLLHPPAAPAAPSSGSVMATTAGSLRGRGEEAAVDEGPEVNTPPENITHPQVRRGPGFDVAHAHAACPSPAC